MLRFSFFATLVAFCAIAVLPPAVADGFTVQEWNRIEEKAAQNDVQAKALRDGYIAGVRDALRFYSKVSTTFPICWPKDHDIDEELMRGIVDAVRREHPDIAKPEDNFAYIVVLSLYDTYPCR